MLSVSRVNVVRIVVALSVLALTLTPFLSLGVNIAFACTGGGSQCGGG
jgi:hypothetical protein